MKPTLFRIDGFDFLGLGELEFHAYATTLAVAFLVGPLLAARDGERLEPPVYVPVQGAIYALIGALIGAKAYWFIQYDSIWNVWRSIFIWQGGYVYYGGLIGGLIAVVIYLKATRTFDWRLADVCAPYLAMGEGIVRIGCFLNGCCWGGVSDLPWAVSFPPYSHAADQHFEQGLLASRSQASLPVHPTQLYMTIGLVFVFLLLRILMKRSPFTFSVALGYFVLYGALRFTVEAFRGDSGRPLFEMTVSQMISLALAVGGATAFALVWHVRRGRGEATVEHAGIEQGQAGVADR